jgi:hypothetical protein
MACGDGLPFLLGGSDNAGPALDAKAIEAGILPDPKNSGLAGRYETRGDLGVDRFCAVERTENNFAIGFLSTIGSESKCEGIGTAKLNGENVEISLSGQGSCKFTARYDGFELRFPAVLDSGCAQYCTDRVSFSGTQYFMIETGNAAARDTLGRDIERLCR